MYDIILSRQRLFFLEESCDTKGVAGEPVIFQTKYDYNKGRVNIMGSGAHPIEKAFYWLLGEI